MKDLLGEIRQCTLCEPELPLGANPIISASAKSKILLISQAPGRIAHEKTHAWDDPSGKRLKQWLGVDDDVFYNPDNFAILPLGFCFPGKAKTGDLPPRPECAPLWQNQVLDKIEGNPLKILIGNYSQRYYLEDKLKLTERIKNYDHYLPEHFVIPHPSPVNRFWTLKNPWFEEEVLPVLKEVVNERLNSNKAL